MSQDYWTKKVAEIRHLAKTETAPPDTIQDMGLLLNNIDGIIEAIKALIKEYWKSLDAPAWAFFTLAHIESKLLQYKRQVPTLLVDKINKVPPSQNTAKSSANISGSNPGSNFSSPDQGRGTTSTNPTKIANDANDLSQTEAEHCNAKTTNELVNGSNDDSNNFPTAGSQAVVMSSPVPQAKQSKNNDAMRNDIVNHDGGGVSAIDSATNSDNGQKKDGDTDNKSASAKQDGGNVVNVKTKNSTTVEETPPAALLEEEVDGTINDDYCATVSTPSVEDKSSILKDSNEEKKPDSTIVKYILANYEVGKDVKICSQAFNIWFSLTTPRLGIG